MKQLEALVAQADLLYRDVDLAAVRAWKSAQPGRKAVGYLPIYVPRELIHAAGMLSVGVVGHGDLEIIRGDAYFQSYICHLPRSVIEMGVTGRLACLDGMLFPSICDVVRNLSGMWKILFPQIYVHYLDVPQNFDPAVGGAFYRTELQQLRHDLETLSGVSITDAALRHSITVFNENRRLVRALYDARASHPGLVGAAETYRIVRAGFLLPVEEHNAMMASYLELSARREAQALDNIRVVISGAFCEQPPVELIHTLERSGCYIVDDDFLLGTRWITSDIATDGDPIDSLVTAFLRCSTPSASLFQADGNNGQALVEKCRARRADGVIFCAPSFCDPALLDQPMGVAALERAKIPFTTFKYAENTGQFQVIREQAGTFSDSIRLWGEQ